VGIQRLQLLGDAQTYSADREPVLLAHDSPDRISLNDGLL
jgi:hypothetical protein